MPGAVPHTSTYPLTNVRLPYAVELANRGWRDALRADNALALGLNTHDGQVTYGPVAEAHAMATIGLAEAHDPIETCSRCALSQVLVPMP
jgi:alanine dehydrogenase